MPLTGIGLRLPRTYRGCPGQPPLRGFPREAPTSEALAEKPADLGVSESLKKVFTRLEPSVEDSPQGPLELPLVSDDGDSPDEVGPSRPWRPLPLDDPKFQEPVTDMLEPEDLIHPRSSEWSPMDKVARYVASRLRKPLDKEGLKDPNRNEGRGDQHFLSHPRKRTSQGERPGWH
ncbi:hypothetical protein NDU88_002217 [Pleurodeles waltl]|uniref:Uncharacterized protein n=1 Tax=Pleurodeles waltl TaxID=8319 RepID=A0AAV7MS47_PLEWA|nr:hypothetical protein NDU88_002217 [Pleurodeles waltl]